MYAHVTLVIKLEHSFFKRPTTEPSTQPVAVLAYCVTKIRGDSITEYTPPPLPGLSNAFMSQFLYTVETGCLNNTSRDVYQETISAHLTLSPYNFHTNTNQSIVMKCCSVVEGENNFCYCSQIRGRHPLPPLQPSGRTNEIKNI